MLINLPIINTQQAIEQLLLAAQVKNLGYDNSFECLPMMLLGDAGCGKTYASKFVAEKLGWQYVEIPAMHRSPGEIGGMITLPSDGSDFARVLMPHYLRGVDLDRPLVINVDEITKATLATHNSWLGLLQERRTESFELPKQCLIVMTGNLPTSKAGDRENPSPVRSRIGQLVIRNSVQDFLRNYAIPANLHYTVTSFLQTQENFEQWSAYPAGPLNTWDSSENPAAYACERAYTAVSNVADSGLDTKYLAPALLGNEIGNAFNLHVEMLRQVPDPDSIWTSPATADVPGDVMVCHYVGNMLAYHANESRMDAIATYLRRLPGECAAIAMTEVVNRHPECRETQAFINFRLEYKLGI